MTYNFSDLYNQFKSDVLTNVPTTDPDTLTVQYFVDCTFVEIDDMMDCGETVPDTHTFIINNIPEDLTS